MGIISYASFGVPRINKISRFFNKQLLCSTLALIHIKKFIEPQITTKNGIFITNLQASWVQICAKFVTS
jgi:hypothetical protein